jgi:hypothetical protein
LPAESYAPQLGCSDVPEKSSRATSLVQPYRAAALLDPNAASRCTGGVPADRDAEPRPATPPSSAPPAGVGAGGSPSPDAVTAGAAPRGGEGAAGAHAAAVSSTAPSTTTRLTRRFQRTGQNLSAHRRSAPPVRRSLGRAHHADHTTRTDTPSSDRLGEPIVDDSFLHPPSAIQGQRHVGTSPTPGRAWNSPHHVVAGASGPTPAHDAATFTSVGTSPTPGQTCTQV